MPEGAGFNGLRYAIRRMVSSPSSVVRSHTLPITEQHPHLLGVLRNIGDGFEVATIILKAAPPCSLGNIRADAIDRPHYLLAYSIPGEVVPSDNDVPDLVC